MTTFANQRSTPTLSLPGDAHGWQTALNGLWQAPVYPDHFFSPKLRPAHAMAPLCALVLLRIALIRAEIPYLFQAILRSLPDDAAARFVRDHADLLGARLWMQYTGALVMPLVVVGFTALLLYLASLSFGHVAKFSTLFAAASYAWLIYGAKAAFSFALLALHGVKSVSGPESLQPAIGLGLFVHSDAAATRALIDTANVFEIWFVVVLSLAVARTEGLSTRAAALIVGASWVILQAFRIGLVYVFQQVVS